MKYRFMRFPDFRAKAVTFSFDDGAEHDRRLIAIMNAHGIKGTFNLCGSHFERETPGRMTHEELRTLYFPAGHEVANHGMNHSALINLTETEGIMEALNGRAAAEKFYGRIIRGFVYPDRSESSDRIRTYLSMLGAAYARCGACTGTFALPKDFLNWMPTCKHNAPDALPLAEQFLSASPRERYCASRDSLLYFVWGHSFECPADNWEGIEKLCALLGGHDDIWYATNIDICEYVSAYRSLIVSVDNSLMYNPTQIRLWFDWDDEHFVINPGETLKIK